MLLLLGILRNYFESNKYFKMNLPTIPEETPCHMSGLQRLLSVVVQGSNEPLHCGASLCYIKDSDKNNISTDFFKKLIFLNKTVIHSIKSCIYEALRLSLYQIE